MLGPVASSHSPPTPHSLTHLLTHSPPWCQQSLTTHHSLTAQAHNRLKEVPDAIGDCHALAELYLGTNSLTTLPDSICNLRCLVRLDAERNRLHSLPANIGDCTSLTTLVVARNALTQLPESLPRCSRLHDIYIQHNLITEEGLPPALGDCAQIRVFNIDEPIMNSLVAIKISVHAEVW